MLEDGEWGLCRAVRADEGRAPRIEVARFAVHEKKSAMHHSIRKVGEMCAGANDVSYHRSSIFRTEAARGRGGKYTADCAINERNHAQFAFLLAEVSQGQMPQFVRSHLRHANFELATDAVMFTLDANRPEGMLAGKRFPFRWKRQTVGAPDLTAFRIRNPERPPLMKIEPASPGILMERVTLAPLRA